MAREVVWRQLFCRGSGCGVMFYICGSCYRGQVYCGERCRRKAQRQQRRDANRRHQQTREGRLDHRDRQRAYRQRRRRARVTDTPSPSTYDWGSITVAEPFRSENGPETVSGEAGYADCAGFEPACIICGRTLRFEPVKKSSFFGEK